MIPTLAPDTRNPWRGKGLAVTTALLVEPARAWTVRGLAVRVGASPALVSKVVARLRAEDLVTGYAGHGARAELQATAALVEAAGLHWPEPDVWRIGRVPTGVAVGGGPAQEAAGLLPVDIPRVYVSSQDEALDVVSYWGGYPATPETAHWSLSVIPLSWPPGPVPPSVVAAELGGDIRGRETVSGHRATLFAGVS